MTLIRSIHVLLYTADEDGAGTNGDVYVGAAGREFFIDSAANDFERGEHRTYRFGTFSTVLNSEMNDPREQELRLEDVDGLPLYIRFLPQNRDDRWKLERAVVAFNSEEFPIWDSQINAPAGIWLSQRAGLVLHLPKDSPTRPVTPAQLAELRAELFAENPSSRATAGVEQPETGRDGELRLIESLHAYVPPLDTRTGDEHVAAGPVTEAEALDALRTREGSEAVLRLVPALGTPDLWTATAFVGVCERTGSARDLQFQGGNVYITDEPSLLVFGSGAWPPTTRVACSFDAPNFGSYLCSVRLRSWDPAGGTVDCRIDGRTFGQTPTYASPSNHVFVTRLGAGYHTFSVYDAGSPFRFFSFSLWSIPETLPT